GNKWDDFYLQKKERSAIFPCAQDFTNFFKHNSNFKPESVIKFYNEWYRPDLMALVIAGDIDDVFILEDQIKSEFNDITKSTNQKMPDNCVKEYLKQAPQFVVLNRKPNNSKESNNSVSFNLYFKDSQLIEGLNNWKGLKRKLLWPIITEMFNNRLQEYNNEYNPFYKAYFTHPKNYMPALKLKITSKDHMENKALSESLHKIKQVLKFGFTAREFYIIKHKHLATLSKANSSNS